ncbi:MAG: hypothetical protein ACK6CX_00195 [Pseudanabaena sp.]
MNQKRITDLTIEDLKAVITEVVVTQLQQWLGKPNSSIITTKPEPTIPTNQPYDNAEGVYILPTRTPEEIAARAKALSDLFSEWDREEDADEQRETWEYLQQALGEELVTERPLSLTA